MLKRVEIKAAPPFAKAAGLLCIMRI